MKKKSFSFVLWVVCLLITTTLSCSLTTSDRDSQSPPQDVISNLPHYGVFLIQDSQPVEISPYYGRPKNSNISSDILITSTTPTLVVWNPKINFLVDVRYIKLDSNFEVRYTITFLDISDVLAIDPISQLEEGIYCLVHRNPTASESDFPYWCFSAVGEQ